MSGTLVDSSVIIDVIHGSTEWEDWSAEAIATAASVGSLAINPVIYAEVSVGFGRVEHCEATLASLHLSRQQIPWPAAFLAGKAFADYRRRGGTRLAPLPDFFIGAHAAVAGLRLLTRDPERVRTYFPRLELIAPG